MTRWQKSYRHVELDDYVIHKYGYHPTHFSRRKVCHRIGPHEGRYINLMKQGLKPICEIDEDELVYFEPYIEKLGWGIIPYFHKFTNKQAYVVFLPGCEWRATKFVRCLSEPRDTDGMFFPGTEARIGFLLGYTKECIAYYLYRVQLIRQGLWDFEKEVPLAAA